MNLYAMANDVAALESQLEAENGDVALDTLHERLDALALEGAAKAEGLLAWLLGLESESSAIAAEVGRLTARKRARDNLADKIRQYISTWLRLTQQKRFRSALATATLSRGRERVQVDMSKVADWPLEVMELCREQGALVEEMSVRTDALRKVLPEMWRDLPGVEVVEGDPILTIR